MIVPVHVATGAAGGAAARSRLGALAVGPLLHVAEDWIPHQDIASVRSELWTGVGCLLLVAVTRGPVSPATIGAAAASAPDIEHVLRLPRPRGRKLFPSHRWQGWHRAGGIPAWIQLVGAGAILGWIASSGPRD